MRLQSCWSSENQHAVKTPPEADRRSRRPTTEHTNRGPVVAMRNLHLDTECVHRFLSVCRISFPGDFCSNSTIP